MSAPPCAPQAPLKRTYRAPHAIWRARVAGGCSGDVNVAVKRVSLLTESKSLSLNAQVRLVLQPDPKAVAAHLCCCVALRLSMRLLRVKYAKRNTPEATSN